MKFIGGSRFCALAALAIFAISAKAGTVTLYTGADDGVGPPGPYTNSAAAQASFLTAAAGYGGVTTTGFESAPLGALSFTAAPGAMITQTGTNYGAGFTGVSNVSFGTLYGFNTTPGGSQYLATSGVSTTITFVSGTHAFGFYLTGLQTVFGTGVTFDFNDGTSQSEFITANINGGAEYFGLTDTSSFSSVTFDDPGSDAWGVDDFSFATQNVSATPEPSSLVLLGTGLLGAFGAARRRFSK